MTEALLAMPAHARQSLVAALETGLLSAPFSEDAVRVTTGHTDDSTKIAAALDELARLGLNSPAIAAWISALEQSLDRGPIADLVWSGPEVQSAPARDTRRVYEELIREAEQSIWVSTYAFFDGQKAFAALAARMDQVENLSVRLLLNIERKWGDTTAPEELVRRFADHFWGREWPGSRCPQVFYDPRSIDPDGKKGVLHAKAMVVDERRAFITSANLTEAALDRNIEAGLLVHDRLIAQRVVRQFQGLVEQGELKPLPE